MTSCFRGRDLHVPVAEQHLCVSEVRESGGLGSFGHRGIRKRDYVAMDYESGANH